MRPAASLLLLLSAEAEASPVSGNTAVSAQVVEAPEIVHRGTTSLPGAPSVALISIDFVELTFPMQVQVEPANEALTVLEITTPVSIVPRGSVLLEPREEGASVSILVRQEMEVPPPMTRLVLVLEPQLGS